jgi:DNA-directed RNA polymerase specialized sigma24 family protein
MATTDNSNKTQLIADIYNMYARELMAYLMSYTHNEMAAEDMLHDLFVKVIGLDVVNKETAKSLLFVTARRMMIDDARHKAFVRQYEKDALAEMNRYDQYSVERRLDAERISRLESYAKNKLAKEELIKKAQEVADAGQWKVGSVKMKELMDSWKKLGFAGPEVNDQVWEAFQAARQTFYDRQRAWYEELDKKHAEAKEKKKAIIEEAKEVTTDTEEWNKTSENLDQLFARWKEAGSAGRSDDDKLWSRFQEVRKSFYERRSAWFDERNARWAESAETKKSLIDEAREILESNDF